MGNLFENFGLDSVLETFINTNTNMGHNKGKFKTANKTTKIFERRWLN